MSDRAIFSRMVRIDEIPEAGTGRVVIATPAERAALAAELGLQAIDSLSAEVNLTPHGRNSIVVDGRVTADIVQTCVVSLVPVRQTVDETFTLRFVRGAAAEAARPHAEIQIDPGAPEPPEALTGDSVDIGAAATEQFVLAIDPYPRAPEAQLPPEASDAAAAAESPFAALANLKKPRNQQG